MEDLCAFIFKDQMMMIGSNISSNSSSKGIGVAVAVVLVVLVVASAAITAESKYTGTDGYSR
jgi:hypothetical protein